MKIPTISHGCKLFLLFCRVFGHHYVMSKPITRHIKEYQCTHCQKQVTTDVSGALSALTPQRQEINHTLEAMHRKKEKALLHLSEA